MMCNKVRPVRNRVVVALLVSFALVLSACGGGGGGGAAPPAQADVAPAPVVNTNTLAISAGVTNSNINLLLTSVTVCAPDTANCVTIDRVLVDTGSTGLRILSSALPSSIALTTQTGVSGNPVGECLRFASGYTWGPVRVADIKMGAEQVNSIPVQIINDPAFAAVPLSCSSSGPALNVSQTLGANGILGIGVFRYDCGNACVSNAIAGTYYTCTATACQSATQALARQVQNPVANFARNNNGVVVQLPAIPDIGIARVDGSLIFGIGTQTNNGLGNATVIGLNAAGNFITQYSNRSFTRSFLDTGSNGVFFRDTSIALCTLASGFYCPPTTLNLTATATGATAGVNTINFSVANLETLARNNPTFTTFNNAAGTTGSTTQFDWGLPFFFGRNVFIAIEGAATPGGVGPYYAF